MMCGTVWDGWVAPIDQLRKKIAQQKEAGLRGVNRRKHKRLQDRERWLCRGLERLKQASPKLYVGENDVCLSSSQMDWVVEQVCKELSGYELRHVQRYSVKALTRGVGELGWDVPVPVPLVLCSMEPSNATPETAQLWARYDALNDAFYERNQVQNDTASVEDDAGELLFSMCFHSGVIHKRWLNLVPDAVRRGAGVHHDIVWLDLGIENNLENSDYEDYRRRQFLAPVTQLLLWRWYKRWGRTWPKDPKTKNFRQTHALLNTFVSTLCAQADLNKSTASQCLAMSRANLVSLVPSSLVHYLTSRRVGPSLIENDWLRLITGGKIEAESSTESRERSIAPPEPLRTGNPFPEQAKLFNELRNAISRKSHEKSIVFINEFLVRSEVSPLLQLIAHWARHLLANGGMARARLKNNTVVRYLNWIKKLLDYSGELADPLNLDEDSWQAVYDELLANSQGVVVDRAGRLAAFHQFLVQAFGVPPVDVAGMSADRQVDARILTPIEYQKSLARLRAEAASDRLAQVREILLIFGFRLGLRRGEAFSRQFGDFLGLDDGMTEKVELLVRTNPNARIKSQTATRRMPLWLLLTAEELQTLRKFYARQKNLIPGDAAGKGLFSSITGSSWQAIETSVYQPLTEALQDVTGYRRFRYHHLRHSFVTFTCLRLFESQPVEFIPARWRTCEQGTELLPCTDKCLWEQAGLVDSGQAIWLLALWAGHASPQVTLECYTHLMDWLVGGHLQRAQDPQLALVSQQVLLDKSGSALEKYRARKGFSGSETHASDIAKVLAGSWPQKGRKQLVQWTEHKEYVPEIPATQTVNWLAPYLLQYRAVEVVPDRGTRNTRGIQDAAAILELSLQTAEVWDGICQSVMAMPSFNALAPEVPEELMPSLKLSTETVKVLRDLKDKNLAKRQPEIPHRFLAPPNTPITRNYAEKFFISLVDWYRRDPELALRASWATLESVQRSHTHIRPRGRGRQNLLFKLLSEIGMKNRTALTIKVNPGMNWGQTKHYWAEFFGVDPKAIRRKIGAVNERLGNYGRCHISVKSPSDLNVGQNLFWPTLRFALLSAYVVCAAEQRKLNDLQDESTAIEAGDTDTQAGSIC